MLGMLIAYDEDGNVLHTRDYQVVYDEDTGEPLGLADYLTHENNGGENTEWWNHQTFDKVVDKQGNVTEVLRDPQPVKGSKVWPEWLGGQAHHFRVELDGPPGNKRIVALVHKSSRVKRKRSDVEDAIAKRIDANAKEAKKRGDEMRAVAKAKGLPKNVVDAMPDPAPEPVDVTDILGSPDRPLQLLEDGRTRPKPAKSQKPNLPIVAVGKG